MTTSQAPEPTTTSASGPTTSFLDRLRPSGQSKTITVLGRTEISEQESHHLALIGTAIALRGHLLSTPSSPGTALAVRTGYLAAHPTGQVSSPIGIPDENTLVYLDDHYASRLDFRLPDWRTRGWVVIGRDELEPFMEYLHMVMAELGTPLP